MPKENLSRRDFLKATVLGAMCLLTTGKIGFYF